MSLRTVVIIALLIAFALLREIGDYVNFSPFLELSQKKETETVNGVLVRQNLTRGIPSGTDLLSYRLAPPPGWSASSFPSLSSDASATLVQSAGLTPPHSPASQAPAPH